ncbi:DNA ligase D [Rurimicrobium arvi]|uniref:DNA ligase (ATP) n=1 Tax=Rurimicrobium arvi TaxID=2049916 RepID=A0ABP8MI04_9BACT
MSLVRYKQKRSADRTPEPFGGKPDTKTLLFVVQKHAASHLHYDFRLEMDGVLKSWAVPKGPSMDPSVKRLAMMVEDHPYDYHDFEGIIPQGEYGGGTVIVWDEGTYTSLEDTAASKKEQQRILLEQLEAGNLKFRLNGKKLKGEFALVRTGSMGKNAWLLIKHNDEYASSEDIAAEEASVRSGKTLDEIAAAMDTAAPEKPARKKKAVKASAPAKKKTVAVKKNVKTLIDAAPKHRFPDMLVPMLATLSEEVPAGDDWVYEVKWDGYRALCNRKGKKLDLYSRNGKSFNEKFPPVAASLAGWDADFVVDGEIIVETEEGKSDFGALQNWRSPADGKLVYYIFDLLWYDGHDISVLPLQERKKILAAVLPELPDIRVSEDFDTSGTAFLEKAKKLGLEGIMAKRRDSSYLTGERSDEWLKIKTGKRQEVVIGGYTLNGGSSKPFSALLVGVFEQGRFIYTGKVGTGFSIRKQEEMLRSFKKYIRKTSPFDTEPEWNKASRFRKASAGATVTWLKPELICEVNFTEMTSEGVMRHPSFEGMRSDKDAEEVHLEKAVPVSKTAKKAVASKTTSSGQPDLFSAKDDITFEADGHELKLTNMSKIYWPKKGVTKGDMLRYYDQVAPFILPYLQNRPLSLNRYPDGAEGKHFYQKDMTGKAPDWADLYLYHSADEERDKHFILGSNEATMLFVANLGCIEFHPWSSTVQHPDNPDWCIIDLDPGDNPFKQVIETANVTHEILSAVDCPCYCKTSGSTGLHIYVPLAAKYTYEQSKEFARIVVSLVHQRLPRYTTLERGIADRKGRMYLDFLQNRPQATLAAPYSLRPHPDAAVSMPLHWDEVKPSLKVSDFNIHNALERVRQQGDIFLPVLGKGISMKKVLDRIDTTFGTR